MNGSTFSLFLTEEITSEKKGNRLRYPAEASDIKQTGKNYRGEDRTMKQWITCLCLLACATLCATPALGWDWAISAGGTHYYGDELTDLATDGSGNVYVTGSFRESATFGATTLTANNASHDVFVAKADSLGNWLWAVRAGGSGSDSGEGIQMDGAGNIYLTGDFRYSADFGATTLTTGNVNCCFIAKLNANGNWLWAKQASGPSSAGFDICTDSSGNCYVAGLFYNGSVTFGTTTLPCSGNNDIFVAKAGPSGDWLWAVGAGGTSADSPGGICYSGDGYLCVVGGFYSPTLAFGATTLTNAGNDDIFVAKLDTSGVWQWAKSATGAGRGRANEIISDPAGNFYATGFFIGSSAFGSTTLTSAGADDAWVAKLDALGNWVWLAQAGGTRDDCGNSITRDGDGNLYIAGYFMGVTSYGNQSFNAGSDYDAVIAKLDADGNWIGANSGGGAETDWGAAIAVDSAGRCFAGGWYEDVANFGANQLSSAGASDIFVARVSPANASGIPLAPTLTYFEFDGDWNYLYLEWDPVNMDTSGISLAPDYYRIWGSLDPYSGYVPLGTFTYSGWGDYWFEYEFADLPPLHFFRVTAVAE